VPAKRGILRVVSPNEFLFTNESHTQHPLKLQQISQFFYRDKLETEPLFEYNDSAFASVHNRRAVLIQPAVCRYALIHYFVRDARVQLRRS